MKFGYVVSDRFVHDPVGSIFTLFNEERRAYGSISVCLSPLTVFEPISVI
jgi:hypothetical protein